MARGDDPQCYVYLGEVDGVVRYVGQGRAGRIGRHLREMRYPQHAGKALYRNLIAAVERCAEIKFYKIAEGLSGVDAQLRELAEIESRPREQLWNMRPGRRPKITDEELLARMSAAGKRKWANPAFREKMKVSLTSPERCAKISVAVTEHMADPCRRAKVAAARRADWKDPAYREKMVAAAARAKLGKPWSPEHRAKMTAIHTDPEYLARHSAVHKKVK